MEAENSSTTIRMQGFFDRLGLSNNFDRDAWGDFFDQDDNDPNSIEDEACAELGEPLDFELHEVTRERSRRREPGDPKGGSGEADSTAGTVSAIEMAGVKTSHPQSSAANETSSSTEEWDASRDFEDVLDEGHMGVGDIDATSQDGADAVFQRKAAASQGLSDRLQQLRELSRGAQRGDQTAVIEIRRILETNEELWRGYGDVQMVTEGMLIDILSVGRHEIDECIRRNLAATKTELLSECPTLLERMSVGRVILCWLFAQLVDRSSMWSVHQGAAVSGFGKLQESAEKRYQTSIKTLRLVQRLRNPETRVAAFSDPAREMAFSRNLERRTLGGVV